MSHGMEGSSPVTAAGLALLRFIEADSVANGGRLMQHPRAAPELAYQALTILARRRFARQDGGPQVRAYVERTLVGAGSSVERRIGVSVTLINSLLAVGGAAAKVPLRDQDLLLLFVVDLARSLLPEELPELVAAAEWRLRRVLQGSQNGGALWRLRLRRISQELRDLRTPFVDDGLRLETPMGNMLEALLLHDYERVGSLPADSNFERAAAVVHGVFARSVKSCFGSGFQEKVLQRVAVRAAERSRSVLVSAETVRGLVVRELDASLPPAEADPEIRMKAETCLLIEVVEEFGLLPSEIHQHVVSAERSAL